MIPKIIHYCWFGRGEMPELALKCIESWKKFCPDYEIMVWNEDSFDINSNRYVKEAYESRKFAFVSDYARLVALYNYGGIYLDTDTMAMDSFDKYLVHKGFGGFEKPKSVQVGIVAAEKNNDIIYEFMHTYDSRNFINENGFQDLTTVVEGFTNVLEKRGLKLDGTKQDLDGFVIYPENVFCPDLKKITDVNYMKGNVTIHYFAGSWKSEATLKRERSLWWKAFAVVATGASKVLTKILGDKWTQAKNKVRDSVIENEKEK